MDIVNSSFGFFASMIVLAVLGAVGWINNIIYIFYYDFGNIGGEIILSIIGVFVAPIGALHGMYLWF